MAGGKIIGVSSATVFVCTLATLLLVSEIVTVNGRYLPTRGQEDRIERLRELLKDLLGNQYDYAAGGDGGSLGEPGVAPVLPGRGHTVMFKREIPPVMDHQNSISH